MRRVFVWTISLSILFLLVFSSSTRASPKITLTEAVPISAVVGGPGTDPVHAAANLNDGDPGTVWRTRSGVENAYFTCSFADRRDLIALDIYIAGDVAGDISLSYYAGGLWLPVPYRPSLWAPGWNRVDLAASKVRTDRLRLAVASPGAPGVLGNLGEIRVWAGGQGLQYRLMPSTVAGEADERFPVTSLTDGDTDTPWALPAGQNAGTCTLSLDPRLERICV